MKYKNNLGITQARNENIALSMENQLNYAKIHLTSGSARDNSRLIVLIAIPQ